MAERRYDYLIRSDGMIRVDHQTILRGWLALEMALPFTPPGFILT
jgi:hypothetical protein